MAEYLVALCNAKAMTAETVKGIGDECESAIKALEKYTKGCCKAGVDLEGLKKDFSELKNEIGLEDTTNWPKTWNDKDEDKRKEQFKRLLDFQRNLLLLNRRDWWWGVKTALATTAVFLVTMAIYLFLHLHPVPSSGINADKPGWLDRAIIHLRAGDQAVDDDTLMAISKQLSKVVVLDAQDKAQGTGAASKEHEARMQNLQDSFGKLQVLIEPLIWRLPTEAIQQLALAEAEINRKEIKTETVDKLQKQINAAIITMRDDFFWATPSGKWLELIFWATGGTLVGILFYTGAQLTDGFFKVQEIPMMAIEVVITPIVVLTIFFIFPLTDITAITPSESSIHMALGISFIFGFAIRRTVGLIDNVKRRLFPDPPQPSTKSGT